MRTLDNYQVESKQCLYIIYFRPSKQAKMGIVLFLKLKSNNEKARKKEENLISGYASNKWVGWIFFQI